MNEAKHWDKIYGNNSTQLVGWYTPHLDTSLRSIEDLNLEENEPIIDVGGGASTLVDDLIVSGHKDLAVLDLSGKAIQLTKERLGRTSNTVSWLQGDVTDIDLPFQHYGLWHDRAVFHFMLDPEAQQKYKEQILKSLKIGGFFIIGTFGADAPTQCSGLPVQRYTPELLISIFGKEFELKEHQKEIHTMPSGVEQPYIFCLFQRVI